MNTELKTEFVHTMLRLKQVSMSSMAIPAISMGEFVVIKSIDTRSSMGLPVFVSDVQGKTYVSKPAVSQMLNNLDKKGFIIRSVDKIDRRKVTVALTPNGKAICDRMDAHADEMLTLIITRLGEADTLKLIELFGRLADVTSEIRAERQENKKTGDDLA